MRIRDFSSFAALTVTALLSACGGIDQAAVKGFGQVEAVAEHPPSANSIAVAPEGAISAEEAARLAKQASFGPTLELINTIVAKKTVAAWLDSQFILSESTYADLGSKAVPGNICSPLAGSEADNCNRDNFTVVPVHMRFYSNAINKNDQLRQRVAFALSQILVTSQLDNNSSAGMATFQQILLKNSFGNYRDILKSTTMNPYMGKYLDMADSNKSQPNENYSRELMQLFSIGTNLLNPDGTLQTDDAGAPIPAYSNSDVKEVARALTGWTYARLNGAAVTDNVNRDWTRPMVAYAPRFDGGAKKFFDTTVPAQATQQENVDAVIDTLFNHPNAAPFISKKLIQQLTVANPTPAYVGRVAASFADNGFGVRGDMKSVIRAIYLDSEARVVSENPGKLKEPVLVATSLARAIGFKTDGYAFINTDAAMGQAPFRATSVFGFYPYDFPLPGGHGVVSPASKLMSTATILARHNVAYNWTLGSEQARAEFQLQAAIPGATGTQPQWSTWEANGADDSKTIDRINLVMMNGTMTATQRRSLVTAMAAVKNSDLAAQARKRAQTALFVVATSPFFQVDR